MRRKARNAFIAVVLSLLCKVGSGLNTPSTNKEMQLSSGGTFSFATLPRATQPLAAKSKQADTFTLQNVHGLSNQSSGEYRGTTLVPGSAPAPVHGASVHLRDSQQNLRTQPGRENEQTQDDLKYVAANGGRQNLASLNTSALGPRMMIKAATSTISSSISSVATFIQLHTGVRDSCLNLTIVGVSAGLIFYGIMCVVWYWVYSTMSPRCQNARVAMNRIVSPHSHHAAAKIFRWAIACTVIFNVSMVIFESNPEITPEVQAIFNCFEAVSSWIFLFEYMMRLYAIPESKTYSHLCGSDWSIRFTWIMSFDSVVDLIAIFPYFVEVVMRLWFSKTYRKNHTLTWLRILRLNRLTRIGAVQESVDVFARVVYYNSEILIVALILCILLVLVLSVIMYYLAPPESFTSSDDFSSVTACMYLALMMLTGQGQPEGKLPWYTKVIVCVTCFFAVGLFAIMASMLTWGFECEAGRRALRSRQARKEKVQQVLAGVESESHSSHSDVDFDDEWEDYDQMLAGSEMSDAEPNAEIEDVRRSLVAKMTCNFTLKQLECVTKIFKYLDISHDGTLARTELESLPSLNVEMIFAQFDKDNSNSITSEEFLKWIVSIKEKQPHSIFSMLLTSLLKECREEFKRREEGDEDERRTQDIDSFVDNVRSLKEDNQRLRKEIQQLRQQSDQPEQKQYARQEQGSAENAGKKKPRRKDFHDAATGRVRKKTQCVNQLIAYM